MGSVANLVTRGGNEAVEVNSPSGIVSIHLTKEGSSWLWAAFSIFGFLAVVNGVIFGITSSKNHSLKKFLYLAPLFTNTFLAFSYFTYAANLGWTSTVTEFYHVSVSLGIFVRQVFYVKYIGWFLAWPFSLLTIQVATHSFEMYYDSQSDLLSKLFSLFSTLITKILMTEIYVLGLLIGILIPSTYKWGYFTFGVTAQLFAYALILLSLTRSFKVGNTKKLGNGLVIFQLLVWLLYPICWGLSEGGNRIQPDSEAVFYGILDVLTFGVIPTILTYLNTSDLDEDFFHKVFNFKGENKSKEKENSQSLRHSTDTAIPNSPSQDKAEEV